MVSINFFLDLEKFKKINSKKIQSLLRIYPKKNELYSRDELIKSYKYYCGKGLLKENINILEALKLKPSRTLSGVSVITVLTKPYPCPGKCIFCPNDTRMPKSYIASEPGAQRAFRNAFDPYLQTFNRLKALKNIGHNVDKVELIILGGTWSSYPLNYRIWFVKRCFEAMNDFSNYNKIEDNSIIYTKDVFNNKEKSNDNSKTINYNLSIKNTIKEEESSTFNELEIQQKINELSKCRNVGLVIETRPDYINYNELESIRRFGATKIQIGVQSLNNKILKLNKRGTSKKIIIDAINKMRLFGFKIHTHIMPNLYGSNVELDKTDYLELKNKLQPDEIKIYPTSVIKNTELFELYKQGKYKPYNEQELSEVLKFSLTNTPRYTRLTRIIRDIPSQEIEAGNKKTNLRQSIESELINEGKACKCIRCREIKSQITSWDNLELERINYTNKVTNEIFLSYKTKSNDKIVGFLRLSIPLNTNNKDIPKELKNSSVIREIHVYGQVVGIGNKSIDKSQHIGIGKKLIRIAEDISINEYHKKKIAVISAIGTREYYNKLGFKLNKLYQIKNLIS